MQLQKFQIREAAKKPLFIVVLVISQFVYSSCFAKIQAKESDTSTKQVISTGQNTEVAQPAAPAVDPRLEKLSVVLSSLSEKCKAAIPNGNPQEFLADLDRVLQAEEGFRKDDLSLFYLIDKKHSVGSDYVPKDLVKLEKNSLFSISRNDLSLRPEAYKALCEMSEASLQDGIKLLVSSTYRSYSYQQWLFQHWVDVDGLEEAERESARAGTSQHQLGTTVDFGSITDDFAQTEMGKWIYAHSEDYGWSLSFPMGYEDITGFRWECWHFRYIGKEACAFQKKWFSDVQQFMIEFLNAWKKEKK